jgi:hypothetical protein
VSPIWRGNQTYHVVALAGNELLTLVVKSREGATRGEEALALGVLDSVLEGALGLGAGVGQGEDDGLVVHRSHLLEDLGGEGTANGTKAHKNSRLDVVDDLLKRLVLLAVVVVTGKVQLVVGELAGPVVGDHALGVDQPEALASLVLGEALLHEESGELLGNTDTSRAGTEEDSALVLGRNARLLDGVDEAGKNHSASALDVVVEHGVGVLVALERGEGVLEVLVLDDNAGPALGESGHHLVEEFALLVGSDLGTARAQVERVVDQVLVSSAEIEADGEGLERVDTGASGVQRQLADRNAHAVDSEVTETENAAAVGDNGDLNIVRPVLDDGGEVSLVAEGKVETC